MAKAEQIFTIPKKIVSSTLAKKNHIIGHHLLVVLLLSRAHL